MKRLVDKGKLAATPDYRRRLAEYNNKLLARNQHPEIFDNEKIEGSYALHTQAPAHFHPL